MAGQLNSTFLEGINEAVEENLESRGEKKKKKREILIKSETKHELPLPMSDAGSPA